MELRIDYKLYFGITLKFYQIYLFAFFAARFRFQGFDVCSTEKTFHLFDEFFESWTHKYLDDYFSIWF